MKKILAMGLILALCLCGCGSKGLKGIPQDTYDDMVKITEIVDEYLDLEMDADEAQEKIEQLRGRIHLEFIDEEDTEVNLLILDSCLNAIISNMMSVTYYDDGSYDGRLSESNQELKEELGIE